MPKILLVEDDVNLREIFEMRLKAEGYDTLTAGDGEEALDVAMKQKPDLIIADVMMPKLSGFEMLESLRAVPEMANTRAIMMTALGQAEDRARGEKLGVLKYLVKSQVTLEDFVRVVRGILSPDNSAAGAPPDTGSPANSSPIKTNQESEAAMQNDSTQNGGAAAPAPGDSAAPTDGAQQSTDQEQQAVQDQINTFVNQPGAAAPSAADDSGAATDGAADAPAAPADGATSADAGTGMNFGGEPTTSVPPASTDAPAPPAATEPAADPTAPPADTGAAGTPAV
jgi:DNA-binding response OmpR family regulator